MSFFPTADKDIMYINVLNKEGGNIEDTIEKMDSVNEVVAQQSNIKHYLMSVGKGAPRFWDTMRIYSTSPDFGQFIIQVELDDIYTSNGEYAAYLQNILNQVDDTLKIEVMELEKSEPVLAPITIQVTSESVDGLHVAKEHTIKVLNDIDGVTYIRDDESGLKSQYNIDYDINAILQYNLVLPLIQAEVNYAINGKQVATLKDDDKQIPVKLIGEPIDYEGLKALSIGHDISGNVITLSDVSSITISESQSAITRHEGAYTITVLANIEDGYSSGDIIKEFKDTVGQDKYNKIYWKYAGEQQSIIDNFADVGMMAIFAAFLILIVIVIQFKSFRQTAIIIVSIPLAASGAIYGLYVTGYPLSFTALFGVVSLMGIVVNNSILLVDSINNKRNDGVSIKEATVIGTTSRIRPILLTTFTTIMGLVPLMISGSDLFAPMAIAIGCGLVYSTLITLLLIPVLYSMVVRDKKI